MKKLLKINLIILIIIIFYLLIRIIINLISTNTNNDILIRTLYILNINEPYIAYYNHANILYKKEKYSEAIVYYQKALSKNPPKKYKCNIKTNLIYAQIHNNSSSSIKEDECFTKDFVKQIKNYQTNNPLTKIKNQNTQATSQRQNELDVDKNIDNFKYKSSKYR